MPGGRRHWVCTNCQVDSFVDGARVTVTGAVVDVLTVDLGAGAQAWALLDGPVPLDLDVAPVALAGCAPLLVPNARITVTGTLRDRGDGRRRLATDHITVPAPLW